MKAHVGVQQDEDHPHGGNDGSQRGGRDRAAGATIPSSIFRNSFADDLINGCFSACTAKVGVQELPVLFHRLRSALQDDAPH